MKKLACIDLGTNTFHLLIVEEVHGKLQEIYRKRVYVILAENGIQTIGEIPFERAILAINGFAEAIAEHQPLELRIIGTEAMRTASNGHLLIDYIIEKLSVQPEIISGKREAELILKGTSLIVDMNKGNSLIMDIGGGSVEFIFVTDGQVKFIESFKVGVTVLYNRFQNNDPITAKELSDLNQFLSETLSSITSLLDAEEEFTLIGASGSYEVLQSVIDGEVFRNASSTYRIEQFIQLYDQVIFSTEAERLQIEGMPPERAKLIVVAFALIKLIVSTGQCHKIVVSPFALKEGVLSEMM